MNFFNINYSIQRNLDLPDKEYGSVEDLEADIEAGKDIVVGGEPGGSAEGGDDGAAGQGGDQGSDDGQGGEGASGGKSGGSDGSAEGGGKGADENGDQSGKDGGSEGGDGGSDGSGGSDGQGGSASPAESGKGSQPDALKDYYGNLSQEMGVEVNQDVIKAALKTHKEVSENKYATLSPEVQKIAQFVDNGGNLKMFAEYQGLDTSKLDNKQLLLEKFKIDNKERFAQNPDMATRMFERQFKEKYGAANLTMPEGLSEEEAQSWKDENLDQIEGAKDALQWDAEEAKKTVDKFIGEVTTIPEKPGTQEMSPEDREKVLEKHKNQVNTAIEGFQGMKIPMPDGKEYTLGLDTDLTEEVTSVLQNPDQYLSLLGVNEDGFDYPKMAKAAILLKTFEAGKIGERMKDFVVETYNKEFVENKIDNAQDKGKPDPKGEGSQDLDQEIAKAFKERREKLQA